MVEVQNLKEISMENAWSNMIMQASFPILNGSNISFHLYSIKKDNEYEILFTFGELLMML